MQIPLDSLAGLSKYWEMLLLTSLLPLASISVLFLRRDFVKGKVKAFFLVLGLALLSYAIYSDVLEHLGEIGLLEISVASVAALITYFILGFAHKHNSEKSDIRGIAMAEFFHSCLDGAIIGMAYFVNPLFGYGTFLAIFSHEAPKIIGTIILIRSLTKNTWEAIKYSIICQAGVPLVSVLVFTFGKNVSDGWMHAVEFAGMATIAVILIRIAYHSYSHRGHAHD
jgi:zinc transporter ZupT